MDIFTAAEKGEIGIVSGLLAADPALAVKHREDGWTALHLASYYGHPEIVGALLANGADVGMRSTNSMQNTPLHAAVAGGRFDVVKVLLENGIDVNATQHGGWTGMQGAAHSGDGGLAGVLVLDGPGSGGVRGKGST